MINYNVTDIDANDCPIRQLMPQPTAVLGCTDIANKTNALNQLIDSECSVNSITQCADILLAQLISQSDSQINNMLEELADVALRSVEFLMKDVCDA